MSLFNEIKKNMQKIQTQQMQEVGPIETTMNIMFKNPTESKSNSKMNMISVHESNHEVHAPSVPKFIQLGDHIEKTHLSTPMEGVSNIYYVNMERSVDRKKHMEELFQDPMFRGIPIERVPAIDGTKESIEDSLDFYQCMKNPRMMATEYGCTLSHFRAIHQFAMTDDPVALIVEDDLSVEFIPYWKKSMKQWIDGAPSDWEVIQLSYILFEYLPSEEYEIWQMQKNLCGTAAYLITNDAAKRLITYLCRFSSPVMPKYCIGSEHPIYHHADRFLYTFFRTYSTNRPPFTHRDSNDSMIHPDHVDFHAESKEKTKKLYLKL